MTDVYINGIGVTSRCACSKEELEKTIDGTIPEFRPLPLDFPSDIPPAKLRRNSRYNKLACATADRALKDAGIPAMMAAGTPDGRRIGTVLSTGYGAAEYNSVFADTVIREDPNACSPSVFSGTVPNSCVGQICILNGLKGFSTILAGGDPLEFSALLLKTGRADYLLAGSVEEYFPPLYGPFSRIGAAEGCDLSEGAAMVILAGERTDGTYCRVSAFGSTNLGKCPYLDFPEDPEKAKRKISEVLREMKRPDMILTANNGTRFDAVETGAVRDVFPGITEVYPKTFFGETLGCGYMMNAVYAAARIRRGDCRSALVTGIDMIGNYSCALLEA